MHYVVHTVVVHLFEYWALVEVRFTVWNPYSVSLFGLDSTFIRPIIGDVPLLHVTVSVVEEVASHFFIHDMFGWHV